MGIFIYKKMFNQDWNTVVLGKNKPKDKAELERKGIAEIKKKRNNNDNQKLKKIENETEEFQIKKIDADTKNLIHKYRNEQKLTQKELGEKLNIKVGIINDYENGKAIPDTKILNKMEKILKIRLLGKNKGEEL